MSQVLNELIIKATSLDVDQGGWLLEASVLSAAIYDAVLRDPDELDPVGGRRFRPTVEQFLRFLDREKLFVDWRSGWDRIVEKSLIDWERNQARATVRQRTEAAVDQLRRMGYEVTSPALPKD